MPVLVGAYDRVHTDWSPERNQNWSGGVLVILENGKVKTADRLQPEQLLLLQRPEINASLNVTESKDKKGA